MPIYTYKVRNQAGKLFSGEVSIGSEAELRQIFEEKELTPVDVKEKNIFNDISQISFIKKKVKVKDLAVFCRQFAIVLEAGIPIASAMDVLREQTENPTLKSCLNSIYDDIQKGKSISEAMKKHGTVFPEILIHMVESGEISGQLEKVFVKMADHFEKEYILHKKIRGAMIYPAIILAVAIIVVLILMIKVVPSFASTLNGMGAELPGITKFLISLSGFFENYWWMLVFGIVVLLIGFKLYSKSEAGKQLFSKMAISLPVAKGITRAIMTARFTRTMGTLIASGVLLVQALEIVRKIMGNTLLMDKMDYIIDEVKKGKGLTQPLANIKYFPPLLISMVRIGEESGELDYTLDKSADFYDREVEAAMQKLTTFIEPVIMVGLGGIVAFIILSILYPMLGVYQHMST